MSPDYGAYGPDRITGPLAPQVLAPLRLNIDIFLVILCLSAYFLLFFINLSSCDSDLFTYNTGVRIRFLAKFGSRAPDSIRILPAGFLDLEHQWNA